MAFTYGCRSLSYYEIFEVASCILIIKMVSLPGYFDVVHCCTFCILILLLYISMQL